MLELLREGGPGAFAALALGVLGLIIGVIALSAAVAKSKGAFGLGVGALLLAIAAAGVGLAGTLEGLSRIDAVLAQLGDNAVTVERVRAQAFRELSASSLVGFFASLAPLAFGALAVLTGARRPQLPTRRQGLEPQVASTDEGAGRLVMALVFLGLAGLVTTGAWVVAHRAPPVGRFDFAADDSEAWALATALDDAEHARPHACFDLELALAPFFDAAQFPRAVTRPVPPALAGWRKAADACVELVLASSSAPPVVDGERRFSVAGLASSVLLHDSAVLARLSRVDSPAAAAEDEDEEASEGGLSRAQLRSAVVKVKRTVQACFERALRRAPGLAGKVVVKFTVAPDGHVSSVEDVAEPQMPDAEMVSCVLKTVQAIRFPSSGDGVTVSYPFVFAPAQ